MAWKNQSYDNLINEILDRDEPLFDLNDIDEEYEDCMENIIKVDIFKEYKTVEEFVSTMGC